MKIHSFFLTLLLLITLTGCYKPPTIEDIPSCAFDEVLIGNVCVKNDNNPVTEDPFCAENEILHGVCIDKTKPVLSGVEDIEVGKYSTFDPLAGVTAIDDVDGDITDLIVVENFVNTDQYGTYIVKYSITDAALNDVLVIRYVRVVYVPLDGEEGIELALNGDFSDDFTGWEIYNNDLGANAIFSVNNEGVCEINVLTVHESHFWVPRMSYGGMTIEQGKTYQVQFDIWADEERLFHLQIGELLTAEPWFTDFRAGANDKIFYIPTTPTTYTVTFTMGLETNLNGGIMFEFGHVGETNLLTTIYLDNISVKEIPE